MTITVDQYRKHSAAIHRTTAALHAAADRVHDSGLTLAFAAHHDALDAANKAAAETLGVTPLGGGKPNS